MLSKVIRVGTFVTLSAEYMCLKEKHECLKVMSLHNVLYIVFMPACVSFFKITRAFQ